MLRHLVEVHPGEEFEDVKWGMFVLKYLRTAFDRQIEEAVTIHQGSDENQLLNSKSEYNQSALPRLVTRLGDREAEIKEFEKELRKEKEDEERIEEKVRQIRKERNRARLNTEKNPQPKKRMKTDESYITIRSSWGPPTSTAPRKNVAEESEKIENNNKKRRVEFEQISLKNVRRIEDRISQGPVMKDMELILDGRNWEDVIRSHAEKLERETIERENKIEKMEIKEKSWALYRECKGFLEKNEKSWEKARLDRELEEKKRERLSIARFKQDQVREKVKVRKLEKDIAERIEKLPPKEKIRLEMEEERKRKLEIVETKKNLWKWRNKGKK